mgnify:CR=1 FL=1
MNYAIKKLIYQLKILDKNNQLINDEDFYLINKLCNQLNKLTDGE